jgi:hypothetical protein
MDKFIEILIGAIPTLIIAFVLIYLFHETISFFKTQVLPRINTGGRPTVSATGVAMGKSDAILKLELQAAERFSLYLERIAPDRLVMRVHRNGMDAKMFQSELLRSIREEFDHNLSQQIYISEEAWSLIKKAKDEMLKFITACGEKLPKDSSAMDLSRVIFEGASKVERLPSDIALQYLRTETRQLF